MNEVTKLYENAGVKKINTRQSEIDNGDPRFTGISHSDSYIKYPLFTAEKQLELIKFILGKGVYYDADENCQEVWFHYTDDIENASYKPFDEAIAEFISNL